MPRLTHVVCCLFCYGWWSLYTVSPQVTDGFDFPEFTDRVRNEEPNPDEDPLTIDVCPPSPPVKQLEFGGNWSYTDLGFSWWVDIRKALEKRKNKKRYRGLTDTAYLDVDYKHEDPYTYRGLVPNDIESPFYFQGACPSTPHWLTAFNLERLGGWCYLLNPWQQKARIVQCDQSHCVSRCNKRNSVCLQDNFRTHYVWVFCPQFRRRRTCKRRPWACLSQVALKLPQSCQCWSCLSTSKSEKLYPK